MEVCKKVQVEYVIHVVESTNLYTHLQFSLLASTWFPRPLGVCLWSVLHMFLVLCEALMLLVLLPIVFVIAVVLDANTVVVLTVAFIFYFLSMGIIIPLVGLWLVITCQCRTMPGRAPRQGLGHYLFSGGGVCPLRPEDLVRLSLVEEVTASTVSLCEFLQGETVTPKFVKHVIRVLFPYLRGQLAGLCREIVPWYDTVVI